MQSPVSFRFLFRSRGAVCAALLCLALLLFSACASAQGRGLASGPAGDLTKHIDPSAWKLSPQAEHLYYYLVLASAMADNDQETIAIALKALLRLDPSLEVYQDSATIMLSRGTFADAQKTALAGLDKFPGDSLLTLLLSAAYSETGQTAKAIELLEKHLAGNATDKEAIQELIRLYIDSGQEAKASALFLRLPETDMSVEAELFRAGVLGTVGRNAEALAILNKLLKNNPDDAELWLELAYLHERENKPEEAIAAYRKAAEILPGNIELQFRLVTLYLDVGEYAKALATARDGRKRSPEQKEFWGLEAFALIKQEKLKDAEAVMRESLKQHPDDPDLLFGLGSILDEAGKKDEAMQIMERILTISPNHYQALNYVGYTLADASKDLDRALTLITAAFDQRPDADYIVDSLAWVQYRLGHFDQAWENITRCIALGGDDPIIWDHYGDIALALGKKDEAIKGWSEAIARKPDNLKAIQKKLDALK